MHTKTLIAKNVIRRTEFGPYGTYNIKQIAIVLKANVSEINQF